MQKIVVTSAIAQRVLHNAVEGSTLTFIGPWASQDDDAVLSLSTTIPALHKLP
jgi:hypothetical protein